MLTAKTSVIAGVVAVAATGDGILYEQAGALQNPGTRFETIQPINLLASTVKQSEDTREPTHSRGR